MTIFEFIHSYKMHKKIKKFQIMKLTFLMLLFVFVALMIVYQLRNQPLVYWSRANQPSFQAEGYLDHINCNSIKGWVWDPKQPNVSISVHIYERLPNGIEQFVMGGGASSYRGDVASYTKDNGNHGFDIPIEDRYKDGNTRTFVVYGFDQKRNIGGGLLHGGFGTVTCSKPPLMSLNLIPQGASIPIEVPRPIRLNQFQCETSSRNIKSSSPSNFWIGQKSNDHVNLCEVQNVSSACPGASISRYASGLGVCIWEASQRQAPLGRVILHSNSSVMPNKGCAIHVTDWNKNNPGGYSSQIVWDYSQRPDYKGSTKYTLGKMQRLHLNTGYQLQSVSWDSCPSNILDPITNTRVPIAQSIIGIILNEVDNVGNTLSTVFYQLMIYDTRPEYRTLSNAEHINCSLSNSTSGGKPFALIDHSLAYYGQKYPEAGAGTLLFDLNLFPQIVAGIRKCKGANVNLNNFKLAGAFLSNETMNTASIRSSFENTKIEIY